MCACLVMGEVIDCVGLKGKEWRREENKCPSLKSYFIREKESTSANICFTCSKYYKPSH